MPYVDREGTPEHTSHFESCGCAEAREAALRAECERLKARIAELEAALTEIRSMSSDYHNLSEIYDRAVTVLLAGEEKEG